MSPGLLMSPDLSLLKRIDKTVPIDQLRQTVLNELNSPIFSAVKLYVDLRVPSTSSLFDTRCMYAHAGLCKAIHTVIHQHTLRYGAGPEYLVLHQQAIRMLWTAEVLSMRNDVGVFIPTVLGTWGSDKLYFHHNFKDFEVLYSQDTATLISYGFIHVDRDELFDWVEDKSTD